MKQKATLKNWVKHPFLNSLLGEVYGHPDKDLPDGELITTSTIVNLDRDNKTAETLNTIYTLEEELKNV
jgi:hypothetical protein